MERDVPPPPSQVIGCLLSWGLCVELLNGAVPKLSPPAVSVRFGPIHSHLVCWGGRLPPLIQVGGSFVACLFFQQGSGLLLLLS